MPRRSFPSSSKIPTLSKIVELDNESSASSAASSPLTPVTSMVRDLGRSRLSDYEDASTPVSSKLLRYMDHSENARHDWSNNCVDDDDDVEDVDDAADDTEVGFLKYSVNLKNTPKTFSKSAKKENILPETNEPCYPLALTKTMEEIAAQPCTCPKDNILTSPRKNKQKSHENRGSTTNVSLYDRNPNTKLGSFKLVPVRPPLEEFDPNSQDSGYDGSCPSFGDDKSQQSLEDGGGGGGGGGGVGSISNKAGFQFAEPLGVAPRRLSIDLRSPVRSPLRFSPQEFQNRGDLFRSTSSGYESTDEEFNDLIDMESLENECSKLPNGLSSLISGNIVAATSVGRDSKPELMVISTPPDASSYPTSCKRRRPGARRSLNLQSCNRGSPVSSTDDEDSPVVASRARSCLFRSPSATCSAAKLSFDSEEPRGRPEPGLANPLPLQRKFKRPEPPAEQSPTSCPLAKRSRKCVSFQDMRTSFHSLGPSTPRSPGSTPVLQRSLSEPEAHAHIKHAIGRSTTESDLTGDFSKTCILPLAEGQHEDLKSISVDTLTRLLRGEFADSVADFKIVDCRYPYEYEGGHIDGAHNLYTKEMIEEFLLDPLQHESPAIEPDTCSKRKILVFHCEFSWERGPNLSRFLRSVDRQRNKEHYPALHYPEIYLLHGGYHMFYKEQKSLCSPQGYRPMRPSDYEADLRHCRSKSKSWQGERSTGRLNVVTARANLKRLAF